MSPNSRGMEKRRLTEARHYANICEPKPRMFNRSLVQWALRVVDAYTPSVARSSAKGSAQTETQEASHEQKRKLWHIGVAQKHWTPWTSVTHWKNKYPLGGDPAPSLGGRLLDIPLKVQLRTTGRLGCKLISFWKKMKEQQHISYVCEIKK